MEKLCYSEKFPEFLKKFRIQTEIWIKTKWQDFDC
jgi:hypothetical protein